MYYYNDEDEYNYYNLYDYYRVGTAPTLVPQNTIQQQIALGRQGHCFKSSWGGRQHTFILMGIDANGMVSILENGMSNSVHHSDMVGLQYLGVSCPPGMGQGMGQGMGPGMGQGMGPGMGQGMGPGMGQGMGPGMGQGMGQQCRWQWTNQGWKWICR